MSSCRFVRNRCFWGGLNSCLYCCHTHLCSVMSDSPFATFPWTVAHQATAFSRQERWNGLLLFISGIFPTRDWNLCILHIVHWQEDSLWLVSSGEAQIHTQILILISCILMHLLIQQHLLDTYYSRVLSIKILNTVVRNFKIILQ